MNTSFSKTSPSSFSPAVLAGLLAEANGEEISQDERFLNLGKRLRNHMHRDVLLDQWWAKNYLPTFKRKDLPQWEIEKNQVMNIFFRSEDDREYLTTLGRVWKWIQEGAQGEGFHCAPGHHYPWEVISSQGEWICGVAATAPQKMLDALASSPRAISAKEADELYREHAWWLEVEDED